MVSVNLSSDDILGEGRVVEHTHMYYNENLITLTENVTVIHAREDVRAVTIGVQQPQIQQRDLLQLNTLTRLGLMSSKVSFEGTNSCREPSLVYMPFQPLYFRA